MTILSNFTLTPITLFSSLVMDAANLEALKTHIDQLVKSGALNTEIEITTLENGFTQMFFRDGFNLKVDGKLLGPNDLIGPFLAENQYCRVVSCYSDFNQLKIDEIIFTKDGVLIADESKSKYAEFDQLIEDLSSVDELPESDQNLILGLSGVNWRRNDTSEEYFATSRFKISAQNQEKLKAEMAMYEWGEHDTPLVDFNDETNSAFISGMCEDHGYLDFDTISDDDPEIAENITIEELISKYAEPNQTIKQFELSMRKSNSYFNISEFKI